MTNIDQFESVFKAADKPRFVYQQLELNELLIVTDLPADQAVVFRERVGQFLQVLHNGQDVDTVILSDKDFDDAGQLVRAVEKYRPDLICTHRNLRSLAGDLPYSLGVCVEALTQTTAVPVLLLPDPRGAAASTRHPTTRSVIAMTDHLAGDHRLVSYAARLTEANGRLILAHVEDEAAFERFMDAIAKIPSIDTDSARETIKDQLLKDPHDYIVSCREVLLQRVDEDAPSAASNSPQRPPVPLNIEEIVAVGHRLRDYKQLVEKYEVDLAVMNTKDEDQLAMHGLAYPLTIELRTTPLLLL